MTDTDTTTAPGIGHNSGAAAEPETVEKRAGIARDQLRSFVKRIEHLNDEKAEISEAIREVFAEAKGSGFDTKTLRSILKLRKMEAAQRREQAQLTALYMNALGMK